MSFHNQATIYRLVLPEIFAGLPGFGQSCALSAYRHLLMRAVLILAEPRQCLLIFFPIDPGLLQFHNALSGSRYQPARDKEEPVSYDLNRVLYLLLIQHLFFKEVHEIVGQHQEFKPGIVAGVAVRDHLIQTKTVYAFFDEVLAAGPFVIIPPDLPSLFFTVGHDHLIVIFHIVGIKKFKLFPGGVFALYLLPYKNHPQSDIFAKDIFTLPCFGTTTYIYPIRHVPDLLLNPWLDRDNDVKFNGLFNQKLDHLPTKKTTIRPKLYLLYMRRQCLDHAFEKLNGMIRTVVFAASKKASNIVPGLTDKAQQRMIALSAFLLRIVSKCSPLLISVYRGHVRIQIQRNAFPRLKAAPKVHQQIKIKLADLSCCRNLQRSQKSADRGLHWKSKKTSEFLKNRVNWKKSHLRGPTATQKDSIQTTCNHQTRTILTLPSTFYFHPAVKSFSYLVSMKKSPDQTTATISGQILATEFYFDTVMKSIAFVEILMYIPFHLLSASFVVGMVFAIPFPYYNRRHFC